MKKKQLKPNVKTLEEINRSHEYDVPRQPVLRFSPTAWAKLLFFRDRGETEISGFGITELDDLLYVTDFITIKQDATVASISLDDNAVADYFENQVDAGRKPEQFFRIWCHTHPGNSPIPSSVDEETFQRVFNNCEWAIMMIVAEEGKTYARLRFNVGPGGQFQIPVQVAYCKSFAATDQDAWEADYKENIKAASWSKNVVYEDETCYAATGFNVNEYSLPQHLLEQLEEMEPTERKAVLDELAVRPDLWGEEVMLYDG